MFGHVDRPEHWARHLLHIRDLQERTGGFTEFVPLPFVHMEAPLYLKGRARKGPTFRETVLMHAVSRLVLHPLIPNIQVSWVKLGPDGAAACLDAGANDLGGTLMNESISRAAGTEHGQEFAPERMDALIASLGRTPRQRTTLYQDAPAERRAASYQAPALAPLVYQRAGRSRAAVGGLIAMQPQPKSKIAVLGGTGKEGSGLALRWANAGHHIVIGSRTRERAQEAAAAINARIGVERAEGADNLAAAQQRRHRRADGALCRAACDARGGQDGARRKNPDRRHRAARAAAGRPRATAGRRLGGASRRRRCWGRGCASCRHFRMSRRSC